MLTNHEIARQWKARISMTRPEKSLLLSENSAPPDYVLYP